jgi:hypothetical protein
MKLGLILCWVGIHKFPVKHGIATKLDDPNKGMIANLTSVSGKCARCERRIKPDRDTMRLLENRNG